MDGDGARPSGVGWSDMGGFRGASAGAPRALAGRTVAITRPAADDERLGSLLQDLGARVVHTPAIRILPAADPGPLRRAMWELEGFDWVVVASGNGARALARALVDVGRSWPPAGDDAPRVCAVGPATAAILEDEGLPVDLIPDRFVAEGILQSMEREGHLEGMRVLVPRAPGGRDVLPDGLRRRGAEVVEVEAYRNVPDEEGLALLREWHTLDRLDAVALTAGSAARRVQEVLGRDPGRVRIAAIGPATAGAAAEVGLPVHAVADPYTAEGLARACVEALTEGPPGG
jgi:uroporphyrinogen-III synthase